jgi:hypothetical protein
MPDLKTLAISGEEKREGFTVLFDGTSLDARTGNKTDYRVDGGSKNKAITEPVTALLSERSVNI